MLYNIQILRFLAALGVLLHHAYVFAVPFPYAPLWPLPLAGMFAAGFAGVDVFFVISGIIMAESTRPLAPGIKASARFIATRFSRIYLGWWVFFALYLAAALYQGQLNPQISLTGSFFLLPLGLNQLLLSIVWTLSFELYFYLMVGLALVFPRPRLRLALWIWAAAVLTFTLFSISRGLYTPARFGDVTIGQGLLGAPLVLEFIAGFLLCDYLRENPQTPWQPFAVLGVALAVLATWYQARGGLHVSGMAGYFHGPERALLIGGTACAFAGCALLLRESTHPVSRLAARLGDASYAIYLSHLLVLATFYVVVARLGIPSAFKLPLFATAVSAVVVYSWLHYRWIERPLHQVARRKIRSVLG